MKTTGSFNWNTRIANFKFSNCGGAADFSLSASPASVSVTQGGSTSSTITVNPVNGFNGSVSLSASGLPAGVTASFNPASTTGNSTLTLTASGAATRGTSAASTVSVMRSNAWTGSVSLSASGLPGGGAASFNPASTTPSSTLTLTASSTATTGTATVTITGTSGSLTHTTTISLTVNVSGGLPAGWTDADIGAVGLAGSASFNAGTFTVKGSGADIFTSADQ